MNRNCKSCLENKPIEEFYKHSCGHRHTCKKCDGKKASQWAKSNPEKRLEIVRNSRKKPENKWRSYVNDYKKHSGEVAKRRASKDLRTPSWLSDDDLWMIKEIYDLCAIRTKLTGIKWNVDHIIPLRGKKVSGFHIPTNLQVITQKENIRKSNRHFQLKEI